MNTDLSNLDGTSVAEVTNEQWSALVERNDLLFSVPAGPPAAGRRVFVSARNGVITVRAYCLDAGPPVDFWAYGPPIVIAPSGKARHDRGDMAMIGLAVTGAVAGIVAWLEQGRPDIRLRDARWPGNHRAMLDPTRVADETASGASWEAQRHHDLAELRAYQAAQASQAARNRMSPQDREIADLMPRLREIAARGDS